MVQLPLNDILAKFPTSLAPLVLARPGGTFSFPVNSAIEQLGTGAVKVRLAQLRHASPPGTFAADTSRDETMIDLPLAQLLAAIGPGGFVRRPEQKVTLVPDDVEGVFGPRGTTPTGLTPKPAIAAAPPKRPAAAAPVAAVAAVAPVARIAPVAPPPPPVAPIAPVAPVEVEEPVESFAPIEAIEPVEAVEAPAPPPPPPPKPAPIIRPVAVAPVVKAPTSAPLPFASSKAPSPVPLASRPAPSPIRPPAVPVLQPQILPAPVSDEGPLVTTVGAICQSWPPGVRKEIEHLNLSGSSVSIPMHRLEAGMKTGRVVFAWGEVIAWLNPPLNGNSSQAATELQLPLSVIAPLFVGKRRGAAPQKKLNIAQDIPDVFGGFGKPSAAPSAPTLAPSLSAAAPSLRAAPAPAVGAPVPLHSGQQSKEDWSPQGIAQRIAVLPGVSGCLLATLDGLLIAGQVPPPLDANTLAAFLPQILGRMTNYAGEVKLGALASVTMSTDLAPCSMFKAGALYLAVVGKPGKTLPEPALLQIAVQLTHRNP